MMLLHNALLILSCSSLLCPICTSSPVLSTSLCASTTGSTCHLKYEECTEKELSYITAKYFQNAMDKILVLKIHSKLQI